MSVKRRDLIRYLEQHGFLLLREGSNHSIYTNHIKAIPVKRHRNLDRITAKRIPCLCNPEARIQKQKKNSVIREIRAKNIQLLNYKWASPFYH